MNSITINLPAQAWNTVLSALGAKPFIEVADLITEIRKQAESQLAPAPAPSVEVKAAAETL